MTLSQLLSLGADLDELLLPWPIDLQLRHCINHQPLLEHIDRVGVTLWQRATDISDLEHPSRRATPQRPAEGESATAAPRSSAQLPRLAGALQVEANQLSNAGLDALLEP